MNYDFLMWVGGIIITGLFSLIGWVFKMVFTSIKDVEENQKALNKSLNNHKIHAAENFATKTEVSDLTDKVLSKLDRMEEKSDRFHERMEEKLDRKADKPNV